MSFEVMERYLLFLRILTTAILLVVTNGCATTPRTAQLPQNGVARTPEIFVNESTGEHSIEFSVLIYNIAGLPWPVSCSKTVRISNDERLPLSQSDLDGG